MRSVSEGKSERIDVRVTSHTKATLQRAAAASGKTVSDFLVEQGLAAADNALADRCVFTLDDDQWTTFWAVLDAPVQERPRLEKLLREPGVLG